MIRAFAVVALVALYEGRVARAEVDWAKGLVTGEGIGIADRHAPSPAAAREPARRMAEDAARKQIAAQLPALPFADVGTLGDHIAKAPALAERIARVVERAITISATPHTDGSWNVTLAVPLEAVRLAYIGGPRVMLEGDDLGPPIVIIEGVTAKPALGYAIGEFASPVLWMKDVPAWAKDAPRIKATAVKPGLIEVPPGKPLGPPRPPTHPSVDATRGPPPTTNGGPSTLYIVLTRP